MTEDVTVLRFAIAKKIMLGFVAILAILILSVSVTMKEMLEMEHFFGGL